LERLDQVKEVFSPMDENKDLAYCPKCRCHWFEEVIIQQVDKNHFLTLGQNVPAYQGFKLRVLRCMKCNELIEPNYSYVSTDREGERYTKFVTEMEAPIDPEKF
jgi:hypothetical protein